MSNHDLNQTSTKPEFCKQRTISGNRFLAILWRDGKETFNTALHFCPSIYESNLVLNFIIGINYIKYEILPNTEKI